MNEPAVIETNLQAQLLDGPIVSLLEKCVAGLRAPLWISPLTGGRSNPTYRLRGQGGRYVLRSRPSGARASSAHRIDREVRVLRALHGSDIPVPQVLLHVTDPRYFGEPFYLMSLMNGEAIEDAALPDHSPAARTQAYEQAIDILARLHRLSPDAVGLAGFGSPGDYNRRQSARWADQIARDGQEPPALRELADRLASALPAQQRTRVVHGDYRFGNLLLEGARISAVLDWELSTLGDPFADLAYFLLAFDLAPTGQILPGVSGLPLGDLGIPDPKALCDRYCRATGFTLPADWPSYRAFALYRTAAIAHGVFCRNADGPIAADQHGQIDRLAEIGLAHLDGSSTNRKDSIRGF